MLKNLGPVLLVFVFFLGCSTKEHFKPKETFDSIDVTGSMDSPIIEISGEGASLENGKIVTNKGIDLSRFPEGFRFVFKNDEWAIALKTGGELFAVKDANESKSLTLSKTIASVALKDDLLAVIFADNELALYEFSTGKLLFKEPASESTAVDIRIANPRFLNELVLFPTLDGKIVIVNAEAKELVRTIIVSSEQYFNNIIYFNIVDDTLYAATASKIYNLGENETRVALEARNMVVNKEGVWVATKQGEVIALDHSLNILKRVKFPFAHFLGIVVGEDIVYVAEKEGYIVALKHDLSFHLVYDFDIEEGFFFTSKEGFYYDDVFIKLY